ncbi:gag protease polyprotein [Cucumis melo var. makuwa]|uniref:Gag protease polyprotein n=1 Tax=Cucumis melo var. makuwa TaxID=1194695 RepID=A0A5D3BHY6_CUCMM|nr:gag protease polyprotein [Cucumis melo var. makuwa]TYJ98737.1 gag protease polyprotein [Cucumis melo var. makuwa]
MDCSCKEVVFNPLIEVSFKYKGVGIMVFSKVILAMKASKLLDQGTWSILVRIVDTRKAEVSLTSKPVSGNVLISRALYKMTIVELKEHKVQLQELLDKGYGVSMDPTKIGAVTNRLRSSTITELNRKGTPFIWSKDGEDSF